MKRYLGLDIGTTSLKAAVFDEAGTRLGLRKVDYTLDTDPELGYIEFDPENYIKMCKTVIDELVVLQRRQKRPPDLFAVFLGKRALHFLIKLQHFNSIIGKLSIFY